MINNDNTPSYVHIGQLNLLNNPTHFEDRLISFKEELKSKDFDFLCLQEVMEDTHEQLEKVLSDLGYVSSAYGQTNPTKHGGRSGNAIFSRHSHTWYEFLEFGDIMGASTLPAVVAHAKIGNTPVYVISTHLAWGGANEPVRLRQATIINDYAVNIKEAHPDAAVLLAGDFNATEETSTVRFLTGKQENHCAQSSYWVDAFEMWGTKDQWATSNPTTYWGASTAKGVGILRPELIPARRIDYIMSYGWCYGKIGSPLDFNVFANKSTGDYREISDHYGLSSKFLVQ